MFRTQRVYTLLILLFSLFVYAASSPILGSENSICPDMAKNQSILEEGQNYYIQHGGSSNDRFTYSKIYLEMGLYAGNFEHQRLQPPQQTQFIQMQNNYHPII